MDMSLDDLIKKTRGKARSRGRGQGQGGRGRGRGTRGSLNGERKSGPVRRRPLAVNAGPSTRIMIAKPARRTRSLPWKTDLFEDSLRAAGISGVEVGTKLYVSNLDSGVSNEDIRELFVEIGDLKRYAIHFDKNGRPSGSAEVVYTRRSDAFLAFKRYNNVLLDGKPMKLEVIGAETENPVSGRVNVTGINGRKKRTVVMTPGAGRNGGADMTIGYMSYQSNRGGFRNGRGRGGGAIGGRGRGRGGRGHSFGRNKPVNKSADELDKDLETYHSTGTGMQT